MIIMIYSISNYWHLLCLYLQIETIRDIIHKAINRKAIVDVVKLVNAHTDNEALTVKPHSGQVYFKLFTPNEQMLDG